MSSRKTISRLAALGGLSTAVILAATACGAGGPATSGGAASNSINVLVEAGGHAELQPIADQCKKDTGISVNFVELPYDGLFNRLSSEFSSGAVSFDVAALDSVWLPSFKDALQPIDELFTEEAKKDIFPSLVKEANVNGHFIGMRRGPTRDSPLPQGPF
ncbi:extracellular solute-binding protein [Arthrobacter sp. Hiyo6]|nr:extracellular solute-binding protein [Arthrobacter sp. Hiyo6]